MARIFWVEDQFHWIDKFKPLLENADLEYSSSDTKASLKKISSANQVEIHKFVESACLAIKQSNSPPDIVILDANMNGNDDAGLTVSRLIQQKWPQVPVVYLSEHSGTGIEERAFEQSTPQDFIAKHQQNIDKVLCWRLKALLRQKYLQANQQSDSVGDVIISGQLKIDLATWNVYWHGERLMNPNNAQRPLAPTPRKILKALVESSPRPVTTMQMAEHLNSDNFNAANYRQHIKALRHSFERAGNEKNQTSFIEGCKQNKGITTFGDEGGYCWIK